MRKLNWTYVAVYYENNNYGIEGFTQLETLAKPYGICVPVKREIDANQSIQKLETEIKNQLSTLQDANGNDVGGVIVFGSSKLADILIRQANELSPNVSFPVFVFSEAIATDETIFEYANGSAIPAARGLFHINPKHTHLSKFAEHWTSIFDDPDKLSKESSTNSWLTDVNQQCQSPVCRTQLESQGGYIEYAIRAALTMAWMVKSIHSDACGASSSGVCDQFCATPGTDFIDKLETANFNTRSDFLPFFMSLDLVISFDDNHEVVLPTEAKAYEVQNYRKCPDLKDEFCFTKVKTRYIYI